MLRCLPYQRLGNSNRRISVCRIKDARKEGATGLPISEELASARRRNGELKTVYSARSKKPIPNACDFSGVQSGMEAQLLTSAVILRETFGLNRLCEIPPLDRTV